MKTAIILGFLFAAVGLAAPSQTVNEPNKIVKRYYGEQFCDCETDCENANDGSGGEGGLGLAACLQGCYDYPTPTAKPCSEY